MSGQRLRRSSAFWSSTDPWVDGYRKFDLPMPPVVNRVYDDGRWRVSYRVADDRFLEIYAIGRSERR